MSEKETSVLLFPIIKEVAKRLKQVQNGSPVTLVYPWVGGGDPPTTRHQDDLSAMAAYGLARLETDTYEHALIRAAYYLLSGATGPTDGPTSWTKTFQDWKNKAKHIIEVEK